MTTIVMTQDRLWLASFAPADQRTADKTRERNGTAVSIGVRLRLEDFLQAKLDGRQLGEHVEEVILSFVDACDKSLHAVGRQDSGLDRTLPFEQSEDRAPQLGATAEERRRRGASFKTAACQPHRQIARALE